MHPKIEEAFQEIDAAVFSSDCLYHDKGFRDRLSQFVKRWQSTLDTSEIAIRVFDLPVYRGNGYLRRPRPEETYLVTGDFCHSDESEIRRLVYLFAIGDDEGVASLAEALEHTEIIPKPPDGVNFCLNFP